jgi:hypothetical protein
MNPTRYIYKLLLLLLLGLLCATPNHLAANDRTEWLEQVLLNVDAGADQTACYEEQITLTATASGGLLPYNFAWFEDQALTQQVGTGSALTITAVNTKTYYAAVTDASGTTVSDAVTINIQGPLLKYDTQCDPEGIFYILNVRSDSDDYTLTTNVGEILDVGNGEWAVINIPQYQSVTYTLTDTDGCSSSVTIDPPNCKLCTLMVMLDDHTICGDAESVELIPDVTWGFPPYTYVWSDSPDFSNVIATTETITVDAPGTYYVKAAFTFDYYPDELDDPTVTCEAIDSSVVVFQIDPIISNLAAECDTLNPGTYIVEFSLANATTAEVVTASGNTVAAFSGVGTFTAFNIPSGENVTIIASNECGTITQPVTAAECDPENEDCDNDGIPDSEEPDCDNDGIPDDCEDDCDGDGIPDDCEPDCDNDGVPDDCEIDSDGDGVPDDCPNFAILDPCTCKNNATDGNNGQFDEIVGITSSDSTETWRIVAQTGMFLLSSPAPPATPDLVPINTVIPYNSATGKYEYEFLHIDSAGYTITVENENGVQLSISNACDYPTLVEESLPQEGLCDTDPIIVLDPIVSGGSLIYTLNGDTIQEIDPSVIGIGVTEIEVTLIPDNPSECINRLITNIIVTVEACDDDCDNDGIPDDQEPDCDNDGIPDDCEPDSDGDGIPDDCDDDCDNDGTPDDQEPDCDDDGIPDDCEVDSDGDGIPDDCDDDCDNDGTPDDQEPDCDDDGIPDDCEVDSDGDGIPDDCDDDCDNDGTPDDQEPDCDNDGIPDDCEPDSDGDGIPDDCDDDCDNDGIPDDQEPDCDNDGIPDDCEPDSDGDGIPDDCDDDCDNDGTPDDQEPDCDDDGIPDDCEPDSDGDGIPDDCDDDCDNDGTPDDQEPDCDDDGIPDDCETDTDGDGIPDDCDDDCDNDGITRRSGTGLR